MTRSTAREIAVHLSFELGFTTCDVKEQLSQSLTRTRFESLGAEEPLYAEFPNEKQKNYIAELVTGVGVHGAELDSYIEKYAIGWNFSRISRMAAAIMRACMYEILYMPDVPAAAAINDAVEIAKGYEPAEVVSFVNGILGAFVRGELPPERVGQPATAQDEV